MDLLISFQGSLSLNSCYAGVRLHKTYVSIYYLQVKNFQRCDSRTQTDFNQVLTI